MYLHVCRDLHKKYLPSREHRQLTIRCTQVDWKGSSQIAVEGQRLHKLEQDKDLYNLFSIALAKLIK